MLISIVQVLKTGTVKNVDPYGSGIQRQPPYIIVKQETDNVRGGITYRIIMHVKAGQMQFMENYIRKEIPNLLKDNLLIASTGNKNIIDLEDFPGTIIAGNDDGTISMESLYFTASMPVNIL